MTKREAQRVARYIGKLEGVRVEGLRVFRARGGASYEIDCLDTRSGYPFIVRSMADLEERLFSARAV